MTIRGGATAKIALYLESMARPPRIATVPPSPRQIAALKDRLENHYDSPEFAAVNCGIPRKLLLQWVTLGRAGHADFVPLVDMMDRANSRLANELVSPILAAAREGNLQAIQWLWKVRVDPQVKRFEKKLSEIEDAADANAIDMGVDQPEEDVAAAEARVLAALEKH